MRTMLGTPEEPEFGSESVPAYSIGQTHESPDMFVIQGDQILPTSDLGYQITSGIDSLGSALEATQASIDNIRSMYRLGQGEHLANELQQLREQKRVLADQYRAQQIERRRAYEAEADRIAAEAAEKLRKLDERIPRLEQAHARSGQDAESFFTSCITHVRRIEAGKTDLSKRSQELEVELQESQQTLVDIETDISERDVLMGSKKAERIRHAREHRTNVITIESDRERVDDLKRKKSREELAHARMYDSVPSAVGADAINATLMELDNTRASYGQIHREKLRQIEEIEGAISRLELINEDHADNYHRLKNELAALTTEQAKAYVDLEAFKLHIERVVWLQVEVNKGILKLQQERTAIDTIIQGGLEGLDAVPVELKDVVFKAVAFNRNENQEDAPLVGSSPSDIFGAATVSFAVQFQVPDKDEQLMEQQVQSEPQVEVDTVAVLEARAIHHHQGLQDALARFTVPKLQDIAETVREDINRRRGLGGQSGIIQPES